MVVAVVCGFALNVSKLNENALMVLKPISVLSFALDVGNVIGGIALNVLRCKNPVFLVVVIRGLIGNASYINGLGNAPITGVVYAISNHVHHPGAMLESSLGNGI